MTPLVFILITIGLALIVYITRALPFLFSKQLRASRLAQVLSRSLPLAIMLLLALHGVRTSASHTTALIGVGVTAFIHLTFKQPIISIFAGTATYVLLIHYAGS
ncbi:branched-chain amino acid transporter permease [Simkania sp.]|uniref:branched-chain amino acid transporter permease n=1 Tax=Simkania sp. TaxID=34094 RepID=UPI003B529978